MSLGLKIFVCHLDHFQYLMNALDYSQIKIIRSVLSNCNCREIICMVMLPLYCRLICNWPSACIFISCNIVPYSCFPYLMLLHNLYIYLQTLQCINCIINCNIVPYLYFPHDMLLNILYIHLQTLQCINCIINCNIVPYSYFPHVLSLHILYIQWQTLQCINCNCPIFIFYPCSIMT